MSPLWSPLGLFFAVAAVVNALWLAGFLFHLTLGDPNYVLSRGMREFIGNKLTFGGTDLTMPVVLLYNAALAAAPLLPLALASVRDALRASASELREWTPRGSLGWAPLVALAIAVAVVVVFADHARLPALLERNRWATDWYPVPTPIDPPLLVRGEYFLTRVLDARYLFAVVNVLVYAVLVGYLSGHMGRRTAFAPVLIATVAIASHFRFFYFLNGADQELPAAVLGLIGVLEVARGRPLIGLLSFTAGVLFKPTVGMYAVAALLIVVWRIRTGGMSVRELPWKEAAVCAVTALASYPGYVLYFVLIAQRGPESFVAKSDRPFFLYSAQTFAADLLTVYTVPFALAVAGWMAAARRGLIALVAVTAFVTRCLVAVAGGYYTFFFVPLMIWAAAQLPLRLSVGGRPWAAAALAVAAVLANVGWYVALPDKLEWVARANSGWDGVIATLRTDLPPGATVYFRKVSPRYDLERGGRRDLAFFEMPESDADALERLSRPGPIGYIAPDADLADVSAAVRALGYREILRFGGTDGARYVVLVKST